MMLIADPGTLVAWHAVLRSWDAWLLTGVLVLLVPVLGYFRFHRLQRHADAAATRRAKLRLYARTICMQWSLVAIMVVVARRHGLSLADLGERLGNGRLTVGVTFSLLAILAVVALTIAWRLRRPGRPDPKPAAGYLEKLVPRPGAEMAAFALVSLTAGVCEELLYRGWLVSLLLAATGSTWASVAIGSAVFGIGHAYQGPPGMLRAGLIGLQLAALFVVVGSLVPGQALHASVDMVTSVLFARAMSARRAGTAPE